MTNVYSFRLKPSGRDKVRELLSANQIAIGWSHAAGLLDVTLTYDEFKNVLDQDYQELKDEGRLGKDTNHLWRFIRKMEIGDIVVVPHGYDIYFVRVSSAPFYVPNKVDDDTAIRRKVVPLMDGSPLARSALPERLQDFLKFRMTSRDLSPVGDIVLKLIGEHSRSKSAPGSALAKIASDQSRALLLEESMGYSRRAPLEAKDIERKHADVWHALVAYLQAARITVSNQRIGVLGPDLFTVGESPDSLFEIKTGAGSSDYLKGVGQLLIYESALGRPFRKYLVLPGNLTGAIKAALDGLDIAVISYSRSDCGTLKFSLPAPLGSKRSTESRTPS